MSAPATTSTRILALDHEMRHRICLTLAWFVMLSFLVAMGIYGFPYYRLSLIERAQSPDHAILRPSGLAGIRLGVLGLLMFAVLFVYPIRKRWAWLSRIGKTKHWLDFHVLLGITAPIVITYHSSFKLRGLAGLAYWIMMAVALSGFIGRYLYALIPRTITAADISFKELEADSARLTEQLEAQALLTKEEMAPLLRLPSCDDVARMSVLGALFQAARIDMARPLHVSRLRRKFLTPLGVFLSLGGLLASNNRDLERVIRSVRTQSWLSTRLLFLNRMHEVFHYWHVIHRPFSYSFVVLVAVHVGVVLLFGFY